MEEITIYKIGLDEWMIKGTFNHETGLEEFKVYLNRDPADSLCAGAIYETFSGACYAIMNEYRSN